VDGGDGGKGGNAISDSYDDYFDYIDGGDGGAGGDGVLFCGGGELTNGGVIDGGDGGAGGAGFDSSASGGLGGDGVGGDCLDVTNSGTISSGQGGDAVDAYDMAMVDNSGVLNGKGAGSIGVFAGWDYGCVNNSGTISGGSIGIEGADLSVVDSGTISGGVYAILFMPEDEDYLTLEPGYSIKGLVCANYGDDSELDLAGSGSASFDLADVGTQYLGFNGFYVSSGTWILKNSSESATPWQIYGGTLELAPSATTTGLIQVGDGGTLAGYGTVNGAVDNSDSVDGIVAPGGLNDGAAGNIGTLTINGCYTQGSTGTLKIEVSPKAASQLVVNGTADLEGGTLSLVVDPGVYAKNTELGFLNATTLVDSVGTYGFGTIVVQGSNGTVLSGGGELTVVDPLDNLNIQLNGDVVVSPTQDSVYTALDSEALMQARRGDEALLNRLDVLGAGGAQDSAGLPSALASADTAETFDGDAQAGGIASLLPVLPDVVTKMGGWIQATGDLDHQDSENGMPGYYTQGGGFLAGVDRRLAGDFVGGVSVGDSSTLLRQSDQESGSLDTQQAAFYGSSAAGPVRFDATAGYAYSNINAVRPVDFVGETAYSSHGAQELNGALQASVPVKAGVLDVLPRAGADYTRLWQDSFTENGAPNQNLAVGADDANSLAPFAGLTLVHRFHLGGFALSPELDGTWSDERLYLNPQTPVSIGGGSFLAQGIAPVAVQYTVGGGLNADMGKDFALNAGYHALLPTAGLSEQMVSAGLRAQF
jgi:uncharacterized protein with beta-barrel porin domain